jgi:PAS domain S-box-containing protein
MTILTLLIGGLALHYVETRLVAAMGRSLTLAAAEIADKLDRVLFERYGDALMIARTVRFKPHDREYLSDSLDSVMRIYSPMYLWLGVTDAQGRIVAATDPRAIGSDRSQTPWFRVAKTTGQMHIGDVEPAHAANGLEALSFTMPIYGPQGEFAGTVSTRVGVPTLEELLTQTIRGMEAREGLLGKIEYQFLTQEGRAFIDSDLEHKGNINLKKAGLPSALLSESDTPGYVEEQHLRRHVAVVTGYARTKGYGEFKGLRWTVLIRMDRSLILTPVRTVLKNLGLAGVTVWVPMLIVLLWTTGRLRREWQQTQQESLRAKAAEAAYRESEERTRLIIETALDAVIVMDEGGLIRDWNAKAEIMFGWTRSEVVDHPFSAKIIPSQYRDAYEQGLKRVLAQGSGSPTNMRFEITAYHKDGHEFPVEMSVSPLRIGTATIIGAFIRDITEYKRAEQRLRVQHATTRILADATTLKEAASALLKAICEPLEWDLGVLWHVDRQAKVLRCLDSWISPHLHASAFEAASRQLTFSQGVGLPGRVWQTGAPAWIMDIVHDDNFPRGPAATQVGLHGASAFPILLGGEVHGVLEFFSRDVRQPDAHMLALMAAIGNQVGHLIERRQLEEQLLQSQKMEAIGRLAGGIAHDFNNLLTVIQGYSQLALTRVKSTDPLHDDMKEIKHAVDRAAALTSQLLAFSRRQVVQQKILDLNAVVRNLEKMLVRVIGEDINLSVSLHPEECFVRADPGQIEQVILNLAINARDAMPRGGKMTIETHIVELNDAWGRRPVNLRPGEYVKLVVIDTGCGMDEYIRTHLFEPFFTTKELGKGTGLGLFTVYGIVKQAGGEVVVESQPDEGTTFSIFLPKVAEAEAADTGLAPPSTAAATGGETVLLVEDEPAIRTLASDVLRRYGYTVLEARHGVEALMTSAHYLDRIQLLVTDVVMPQMSGNEVAQRLLLERPDLKVLYISGYTDDAVVHHGSERTAFLQKPFTPDTLVLKVRELLDTVRRS